MAISSHGFIIRRNGVDISNLGNVILPQLARQMFEVTRLSDDDERLVPSLRQVGELSFEVFWNIADHEDLIDAWMNASDDEYEMETPDGATWHFSGYIINIEPLAPVDGVLLARIVIRPDAGLDFSAALLTEAGDYLLLENGFKLLV